MVQVKRAIMVPHHRPELTMYGLPIAPYFHAPLLPSFAVPVERPEPTQEVRHEDAPL